jgi:hypothetical protein
MSILSKLTAGALAASLGVFAVLGFAVPSGAAAGVITIRRQRERGKRPQMNFVTLRVSLDARGCP